MHVDVTPEYRGRGRTAVSASGEGWTQSRRKGSGAWTPQSSFYFMSRILYESDSENPGPDVEPGLASASPQGCFPGPSGDGCSPALRDEWSPF